jgi:hypothetical protein
MYVEKIIFTLGCLGYVKAGDFNQMYFEKICILPGLLRLMYKQIILIKCMLKECNLPWLLSLM